MTNTLINFSRYCAYKESTADWVEIIPSHWKAVPLKHILKLISEKVATKKSDSKYLGMENVESFTGKIIETDTDVEGLASHFLSGDILFGKLRPYLAKIALPKFTGICSTEFLVYRVGSGDARYFRYMLVSEAFIDLINSSTYGSKMPRASADFIGGQKLLIPPESEQRAIADFLNKKNAKIDQAIQIKEHQIALLKERKQILIQQAVTRGLNPDAPMRDAGIEWIGEIPAHWSIKRAKYIFREVDERSPDGQQELLSVSHVTGVTPRSEKNVTMFMAEDYSGSKTCQKDDLVFNIMWAWMGALGVSDRAGIVSSSYGIFRQLKSGVFNQKYLEMLLKSTGYIEHYNKVSTGLHSSRLRFYGHMFMAMEIGFPDRKEQDAIVAYLDLESGKLDKAIELLEQQITKLKEYKATLINSAVTGKIKVPGVLEPEVRDREVA